MIRSSALLVPALAVLTTTSLGSQTYRSLGFFGARNEALPGAPSLVGMSYSSHSGPLGFRLSGAFDPRTRHDMRGSATAVEVAAWTADADIVLSPARQYGMRLALGGIEPSLFAGAGGHGVRDLDGGRAAIATWSWGAGLGLGLSSWFGIEGEARRRSRLSFDPPAQRAPLPPGFVTGWEYRAGISFRFGSRDRGGHRSAASSTPRSTAPTGRGRAIPTTRSDRTGGVPPNGAVRAASVLATADDYLGTPYLYGGTTPAGFDCSGFVQYVFRRHEIDLPRTSRQQAQAGGRVSASLASLRAGDLMFFASSGSRIDHVAIYAGNGRIIHSSSSGRGVRHDDLSSDRGRWFTDRWVASRRVIADGRSLVNELDAAVRSYDGELDSPDGAPRPR